MVKLRILVRGKYSGLCRCTQCYSYSQKKGRSVQVRRLNVMIEINVGVVCFEDRKKGSQAH